MAKLILVLALLLCGCATELDTGQEEQALCPALDPGGHEWTDYIDSQGRPVSIYVNYFQEYCSVNGGQGIRNVFWSMVYLRPTYTLLSSRLEIFNCNSCGWQP
jgi:hypothetical protein